MKPTRLTISLLAIPLLVGLLASCGADSPIASTHPLQQQVDKLVFVQGGTFMMGDAGYTNPQGEFSYFSGGDRNKPAHQVTLSSYSIQAYETTFREFDTYMTSIGEKILRPENRHRQNAQPDYPAKWMTWYQAQGYCQWLGNKIGYPMSLPTEAQWEYAARSRGKTVAYATDNGVWERGRNMRDPVKVGHAMPVGSWPPNPLGLYDMTGNVWEWTVDFWHPYEKEPLSDPNFNNDETAYYTGQRISRGGAYSVESPFMAVNQ